MQDPTAFIEERVRQELESLRKELVAATDKNERRRLEREMSQVERNLREALSGHGIAW